MLDHGRALAAGSGQDAFDEGFLRKVPIGDLHMTDRVTYCWVNNSNRPQEIAASTATRPPAIILIDVDLSWLTTRYSLSEAANHPRTTNPIAQNDQPDNAKAAAASQKIASTRSVQMSSFL